MPAVGASRSLLKQGAKELPLSRLPLARDGFPFLTLHLSIEPSPHLPPLGLNWEKGSFQCCFSSIPLRYNNCIGYLPSMCLQPYKNPHHKLQTIINCGLNISTPNLCSSLMAPQPLGEHRVQACSPLACEEDLSSLRGRSRSLPSASSTPDLESDSTSLSSGSSTEQDGQLSWQPNLSRSLPEVEQARSPPLGHALAMHNTKSPRLTPKDRNDSGFVESSAADLSSSLTDQDGATCVPKVPARPSPQEILQRCSTVTKRAVQCSRLCSPAPACVLGGTNPALGQPSPHH